MFSLELCLSFGLHTAVDLFLRIFSMRCILVEADISETSQNLVTQNQNYLHGWAPREVSES